MPGYSDLLRGMGGPMDPKALAGQMGMASQFETAGGPVQNQMGAMPPPGGMDMLGMMGPMQGAPPPPGPMGGEGMMNPMMAQMMGQPPAGLSPDSDVGIKTLLEFAKLEDQDIIELVMNTKPQEEVADTLMALGQQLGRPALIQAAQQMGMAGEMGPGGEMMGGMQPPEMQGMGEGMVG